MWVSHYRHGRDTRARCVEFPDADAFLTAYEAQPWPQVDHKILAGHKPCPLCAPSWSPVRTTVRKSASVTELWGAVFDWDNVEDMPGLYEAAKQFHGILHTTLNHWRKPTRMRGIFPFTKAAPPGRAPRIYESYQDFFGTKADPVSKAASAQFFFGVRPGDPPPKFLRLTGQPLDPWQLPGAERFEHHHLMVLSHKFRRRDPQLSKRFKDLHDGVSFAQPVELGDGRNDAAFLICSKIAAFYPLANPERAVNLFAPSLQIMAQEYPEGALTRETILDMLVRLLGAQTHQETEEQELQGKFWESHGEPEREGTYLESEIEALEMPGRKDWLLDHRNGLYIRTIRGFEGPALSTIACVREALSVIPGTNLYREDGSPLDRKALINKYARSCWHVLHSLRSAKASFDPATSTLRLASTPIRTFPPERSAFVDEWFGVAFSPEDRARVEAWLSLLPDLSRPLSCLMIVGDQGAGKNVFAYSCARFWSTSKPAMAAKVLGRFNGEVLSCPLAWVDEKLPTGHDGYFPLEEFKHLIGAETFTVELKGQETAAVEGYMRWIATANADLFTSAYSHSAEGNMALSKRILRVQIRPESAGFLAKHQKYLHEEFGPRDVFVKHVLALPKATRTEERFGITSPATFERTLAVGSTWGGRICQLVLTWLLDPKPAPTKALAVIDNGLWINGAALLKEWRTLSQGRGNVIYLEMPKDMRQVTECLGPLLTPLRHGSVGDRKMIAGLNYRKFDIEKLTHWAESVEWAPPQAIWRALGWAIAAPPVEEQK